MIYHIKLSATYHSKESIFTHGDYAAALHAYKELVIDQADFIAVLGTASAFISLIDENGNTIRTITVSGFKES
jgi:hypothetical protein